MRLISCTSNNITIQKIRIHQGEIQVSQWFCVNTFSDFIHDSKWFRYFSWYIPYMKFPREFFIHTIHIGYISRKISKSLGIMYKIRKYVKKQNQWHCHLCMPPQTHCCQLSLVVARSVVDPALADRLLHLPPNGLQWTTGSTGWQASTGLTFQQITDVWHKITTDKCSQSHHSVRNTN